MCDDMSMKITSVDYVTENVDGVEKSFVIIKSGDTIIDKIPEEEYWKKAAEYYGTGNK